MLLKEEIRIEEAPSKKLEDRKHFYVPLFFDKKVFHKEQKYDTEFYKKIGLHPTAQCEILYRYVVCKEGMFPLIGDSDLPVENI